MVFQSYALWPHMSVAENVAFPLREGGRGVPRHEVAGRVAEVLDMLGLSGMRDRAVTTLSGGQQQRVALARALSLRPRLLLMDEPLSNLDYELQVRLRGQVKELVSRIGVTTLYVTHNQNEALEMADRLAVMDAGRFRQIGTPRELYLGPTSEFVARFIGDMNLFPAKVVETGATLWVESALGRLQVGTNCLGDPKVGQSCLLGVRQEDIEIAEDGGAANVVSASVERATFSGDSISYQLNVNGTRLQCRLHRRFDVPEGRDVLLRLPPEHCLAVPADGAGAS
jgi:iron(III) transport system ATP-binding protein